MERHSARSDHSQNILPKKCFVDGPKSVADGKYIFRLAPLATPPADALTKTTTLGYPAAQLFAGAHS